MYKVTNTYSCRDCVYYVNKKCDHVTAKDVFKSEDLLFAMKCQSFYAKLFDYVYVKMVKKERQTDLGSIDI